MYGYVYKTTNLINGKCYIGQHQASKFEFNRYIGSGTYLKKAIKKYGKENFRCELLETCDSQNELDDCEEKWISFYNAVESKSFYNIDAGGNGVKKTKEHKQHLCEAWTDERRNHASENFSGDRNPSKRPEVRKKMSENNSSHRPEIRRKISASKKGKLLPHTEEWNKNIGKALKGRQLMNFTDDVRRKISESKKGENNPMHGKSAVKGSKWYNNGIKNIRAYECPEGFVEGVLKK